MRHALPRTVVGMDWQDNADGGLHRLDHELSHHMGGRGGGSSGGGAESRSRHSASFLVRWRLARKPTWRMRWKPSGTVCCRKRRMNSSAGSVMTLVLPSWR